MEQRKLKCVSCPSDPLSYTNRAVVNGRDIPLSSYKHAEIATVSGNRFVFTLEGYDRLEPGGMGFNVMMRKWAQLSLNEVIDVRPYIFDTKTQYVTKVTLYIDFLQKNSTTNEAYDTDDMALDFHMQFPNQAFTVGQTVGYKFADKKLLKLTVKEMETVDPNSLQDNQPSKPTGVKTTRIGMVSSNSQVLFEKGENSAINLTGKAKGKLQQQAIINPSWDFENMGIGGLDKEFNAIFRRAFASRVFPVDIIEQLGLKHVRGILLFGPPGTGKTLMARQIGQMLNAREPKIVNGPQILDKYVGESEANIRRLFEDAEAEFKKLGNNSGLHIIIFDEIDAICKSRGSVAGNSGVHDTVVNQLLSKIDGIDSLNNILVIGMTNRRDMIDEALLRPGRMEVQMEIGLPNEHGRLQILNIHTTQMKRFKKLSPDVNLNELATLTKNFSGAEIEGLVRAAQSTAMNRLIKASSKVEVDPDAIEKLLINRGDFLHALENDVKPAFGTSSEVIEKLVVNGIIPWGKSVSNILEDGMLFIQQARDPMSRGLVSILLEGPPNSGKTALAAKMALNSEFPFIKLCSPDEMVGYTETAKCLMIKKVFDDAYKSQFSCILVDNIERLLDYGSIGPRYSNLVLQALLVLLKKEPPAGRKLLVLCTTSRRQVLEEMEMVAAFTSVLHVPNLTKANHLAAVIAPLDRSYFSDDEKNKIVNKIGNKRLGIGIKKMLAFVDMAKQMKPQDRVMKFLCKLEEEGCLEM